MRSFAVSVGAALAATGMNGEFLGNPELFSAAITDDAAKITGKSAARVNGLIIDKGRRWDAPLATSNMGENHVRISHLGIRQSGRSEYSKPSKTHRALGKALSVPANAQIV